MSGYVEVQCGECGGGPITTVGGTLHCHKCGKTFSWSDFEAGETFWNPQWGVLLVIPQRALDVMDTAWRDFGLRLSPWHMGGGCMALGGVSSDGREVLVTDGGGSDLPGRWAGDDSLIAGVTHPDNWEDGDDSPYLGDDIEAMVGHLIDRLRKGGSA